MRNRRYTQEIGVATLEQRVSPAVAAVVLAIVLVVAGLLVRHVVTFKSVAHAAPEPAAGVKLAKR